MNARLIGHWTLALAVAFTGILPNAGQASEQRAEEPITFSLAVHDVALSGDGMLRGALSNSAGKPQPDTEIKVLRAGEVIATATSDSEGRFSVPEMRPGLYEINTARSCGLYRVWQPSTAPPVANQAVLIVERDRVLRAQEWSVWRRTLILGGVIITSGVIGGVIGYNIKDDAS